MAQSKYFFIRSKLNEKLVLDIKGAQANPNTPVVLWNHNGGKNQQWFQDHANNVIRSRLNEEFVLELRHDGSPLMIERFKPGHADQQWSKGFAREGPIRSVRNNEKTFDVWEAKKDEGAVIKAFNFHGGPNQMWKFESSDKPVHFYIHSALQGNHVLDVKGESSNAGTPVILYDKHHSKKNNQLWWEDENGIIHSKLNNFAFDVSSGSLKLEPYDVNNQNRQWVRHGNAIVNARDPSLALDISKGDQGPNAVIIGYKYHGGQNQQWTFENVD